MNWVAVLIILVGQYLLISHPKLAFVIMGIGSIMMSVLYFQVDLAVFAINIAFTVISGKNLIESFQNGKKNE
jgi:hypothetical protein